MLLLNLKNFLLILTIFKGINYFLTINYSVLGNDGTTNVRYFKIEYKNEGH